MPKAIPKIIYPVALDSNYTLFSTHNSSQSVLAKDLSENNDVIEIYPKIANEADVWADNGFVTIENEIIYYDSVIKNKNNKITQLKDCIRGVEGKPDSYSAGTPVSANVVAQLHNQLVDAVIAIEDTIGDISDMLKIGNDLKIQQKFRKNLVPNNTPMAMDASFNNSLHQSLTSMLGCAPVPDDNCPDVEFEFNILGATAEYCVRIFGDYTAFEVDFGDGNSTTTQLSGTITFNGGNPTVTVTTPTCTLVQMPTTPDSCDGPTLPNPSIPFVIAVPEVPDFPGFTPNKLICPGPLFNLPPIQLPGSQLCSSTSITPNVPSFIVSVIEACKTPQVIRIVSPCRISIISLVGCELPSQISLIGCCPPSIIHVIAPSFDCIEFCEPPSFDCVSFCQLPSFDCISFCMAPSFDPISFAPFPSIGAVSFEVGVDISLSPICFCEPPSFDCISFCEPPSFAPISITFTSFPNISTVSFDVEVGVDLSLSPICFCEPPSFDCISFCEAIPSFNVISFANFPSIEAVSFDVLVNLSLSPICFCEPPSFDPISFAPIPNLSFDVVVDLSLSPICFCEPPSFDPISFAPFPNVDAISFDVLVNLSLSPICFCEPPSFDVISFAPFPSIDAVSFDVVVGLSLSPICFCEPPSFDCIDFCEPPSFDCVDFCDPPSFSPISFDKPPTISVDWGNPPKLSCIVTVACPSSSGGGSGFAPQLEPNLYDFDEGVELPITIKDLGLPEEIKLIGPDLPREIFIRGRLPEEIVIKGDIPRSIEVQSDIPHRILLDANDVPRKILVEMAPDFPSVLRMDFTHTLQVTGIPKSIEIVENIPRTIQLLMPENPVIELKYSAGAIELKPSADLEKMLANLMIQPK